MNIKQIITVLTDISELISCNIYDADAMRELEPDSNWPRHYKQLQAISSAIKYLTKLDNFTKSIVYFNSNREVK